MKRKAIGVFDSGLGGLTAVKELKKILPNENVIYFGDTSRVPYGTRSCDTIMRYAAQDLNFLSSFDIKIALVACGTVSAVALSELRDKYPFEVIGVIESTVDAAIKGTRNGKIGIIGTNATIKSNAYANLINKMAPDMKTISVPCPLFVPLVENGHIRENDPITREAVKHYLSIIKDFGADTVILGCTHYPIISRAIGEFVGQETLLVNSGREAAKHIRDILAEKSLLSDTKNGINRYFVSDSVEDFKNYAGIFMHSNYLGEVEKIDIEKY